MKLDGRNIFVLDVLCCAFFFLGKDEHLLT